MIPWSFSIPRLYARFHRQPTDARLMMTPAPPPTAPPRHAAVLRGNLNAASANRAREAADAPARQQRRWTRRHWLQASLLATLGVLVMSLVPGVSRVLGSADAVALSTLPLPLPQLTPVLPADAPEFHWHLVTVERNQTLGAIFAAQGLPGSTLRRVLDHADVRTHLARLRPGMELGFDLAADGSLRAFRFDRSDSERVHLILNKDAISERVIERELETRTVLVSGEVGRSLFHSARKLGLPGTIINTLTDEIFQYDIDFSRDVVSGDRFSVLIDQTWREGELIRSGPVRAAVFTAKGRPFTAVRFEHEGKAEYFNSEGRPLKKSFIRSPVQYARLSSNFGMRRHPILGTMRAHKGVDYAAPTGTPIMAAGDARVVSAGWQRGYGNTVVLDHGRGYTTLYGHMSRTAKLHRGQQVSQGEVIGYVGATGMATGPHLHYEFRVNGVHRDPLRYILPPPEPLHGEALAGFLAQSAPTLERMREIEDIVFARPLDLPADGEAQQAFAVSLPANGDEG